MAGRWGGQIFFSCAASQLLKLKINQLKGKHTDCNWVKNNKRLQGSESWLHALVGKVKVQVIMLVIMWYTQHIARISNLRLKWNTSDTVPSWQNTLIG